MKRVQSVCPFCGVGCGMELQVQKNCLSSVIPLRGHPVSDGQLCVKGWNTRYAIDHRDRVLAPLIRTQEGFRETTWKEAIAYISDSIKTIDDEMGSDALGVISSARATNEDNYAAQKFARAVLKTNNIDHCARICHSSTVAGLKRTLGSGAMTNSIADVFQADAIMVFGADPTENHSVVGGKIMKAKLAGARLIVVDPRKTRLAKMADIHLQLRIGSNIALLNAMMAEIVANGWHNETFIRQRCTGFDHLTHSIEQSAKQAEKLTGLDLNLIRQAAQVYSQADSAMIMYGMGVTQFVSGTNNVMALADLALLCGQIGRPGTGVNPLRGQNNVQGACDMGCLPNVFPGYQSVDDPVVIQRFSEGWETSLSDRPGLTSMGMTQASLSGDFRGLIIIGEDPVVTDPDQNQVRRALQRLDLLVVAELAMTETAKLADVILPAASFAEKDGTFTNCERRVQRINKAIPPPGDTRTDWRWLAETARALGSTQLHWQETEDVFNEMARLTPIYSGMDYQALAEHQGLQWPCNADSPEGSPFLHGDLFPTANGKAAFVAVNPTELDETADEEFPLLLTTNRLGFHYGCGSMSRRSPLLERETPPGYLFIHPLDAQELGIGQHEAIGIRSRRGYVETRAMISEDVAQGLVSMPYHFREAPSNQLTNNAQDPVTKMPELKACAVSVKPLPAGQGPRDIDTIRREEPA